MCTSIISNRKKTIVGWNLDILDMQHRITATNEMVCIEVFDEKEGWLPLFGANNRGDFVAMPTCWPYDSKSDPKDENALNILMLDIDLLLKKRTFSEVKEIANGAVASVPGITFMAQLSDKSGNVLQVIPGQGSRYIEKPAYSVMTNFSPFKMFSEVHPFFGKDRYETAVKILEKATDDFDVTDCFELLKVTSQIQCPTVVSMVFDVENNTVYWCENRDYDNISSHKMIG